MRYLVSASEGPGFASQDEAVNVLEKHILPTFEAIERLEGDKKIVAGGLPVAERAFVFVAEAASNEDLDTMLRDLPAWGLFEWNVTPLQSFGARAAREREVVKQARKSSR